MKKLKEWWSSILLSLASCGSAQQSDAAENEALNSIAGEDVNDTKLDLARAYIDMDEIDNAKILLKEVLSQGDASQKNEAKTLLNELKE